MAPTCSTQGPVQHLKAFKFIREVVHHINNNNNNNKINKMNEYKVNKSIAAKKSFGFLVATRVKFRVALNFGRKETKTSLL